MATSANSMMTLTPASPTKLDGVGDPDCPVCHGLGYIQYDVPTHDAKFGKIFPCTCQLKNMQLQRALQLRADSNTESLAGKTFDNFLPEGANPDATLRANLKAAYERCKAFADSIEKSHEKWLLIIGTYGCGKTHLAAAIANQCLAQGQPALFLNTPDLLDYLRETFAPHSATSYSDRFDEIRDAPLLILDDLGTESPTPWAIEKLYQLLNYRYNAHLATVITTNKKLEEIEPRIASRLSDSNIVSSLDIRAPDFRAGKFHTETDVSTLPLHRHQTFEAFDSRADLTGEPRQAFLRAIQAAHDFANAPHGWLVFVGPYGAGKTHLAAAIANQRVQAGKAALLVAHQDLGELFKSTNNREIEERRAKQIYNIKNVELLVLDDISSQLSSSGYYRDRFFQVINYRFDAQLPTVLTTAAEEAELDERLKSRIFYADYCQVHVLKVPPYRGKKKVVKKK